MRITNEMSINASKVHEGEKTTIYMTIYTVMSSKLAISEGN